MNNINSISTFGAHPKEFDPVQVKPVLLDLATTLRWYLKNTERQEAMPTLSTGEPGRAETEISERSIAVLPFRDMSPGKDQDYFCDGISEEIINLLSRKNELKVVARSSSFAFRDSERDIREIGRRLEVKYILEGSIRKNGKQIRISAQ